MEKADKLDSERLQKLTTWTPEKLKLDFVTESKTEAVSSDKIDLLFEGLIWAGALRH